MELGHAAASGGPSFSTGLASLRGVAALGVVAYHALLALPAFDWRLLATDGMRPDDEVVLVHLLLGLFNGRGLVTLFFVLSGTVLALAMARQPAFDVWRWPGYCVRRGARLYPLLIVAATLGALLQWAIGSATVPIASHWVDTHYAVPPDGLLREWAKNAIGGSASLNSPAWSIRVELIASLLFPLIYLGSRTRRSAMLGLGCCLLLMFALPAATERYLLMNVFLFSFWLGAVIPAHGAALHDRYRHLGRGARATILAVAVAALMFSRGLIDPISFVVPAAVLIESLAAGVIVLVVLFRERTAPPTRTSAAMQWLGEMSYGVYLLHLIILFALIHAFLPGRTPPVGMGESVAVALALLAGALAVTLPLAWLIHRFVEQPGRRLGAAVARRLDVRSRRPLEA